MFVVGVNQLATDEIEKLSQQICDATAARLQLVEEVVERRDALLQTLAFSGVTDNPRRFRACVEWIARQDLPVIKDTLWECLTSSIGAQISSKACHRQTTHTQSNNLPQARQSTSFYHSTLAL